ncbi:MAG: YIP1 family protein [Desulfobacteraceae bacterium]
MTLTLVCPYCRFSRQVFEAEIPAGAKRAVCPRCGQKFEFRAGNHTPSDYETVDGPDEDIIHKEDHGWESKTDHRGSPWEARTEIGILRGIVNTLSQVLFSPGQFFKALAPKGKLGESMAFGLLMGAIGNMLALFWPVILMSGGLSPFQQPLLEQMTMGMVFLIMMVVVPFCVLVAMFVYSAILHFFLFLVRGGRHGFEATFRVIAYSQAAQIWSLIPMAGGWIGGVWQVIVQVIGLREIHHTSYFRVIMAFILPVVVLFVLALSALIPLILYLFQQWSVQL